jgi:hypothetical protein
MTSISPLLFGIAAAFSPASMAGMETVQHLGEFPVVELRRYHTSPGGRARFASYFDAYFPEAFEQLGAIVFGQFTNRDQLTAFTWLRGYKDISARAIVCGNFYYGPLWKEHRTKVNAILPDSDNVLLLHPLASTSGVKLLPAVDPVDEPKGAQGIVVTQLFAIKKGQEDVFAAKALAAFSAYRVDGVQEAGVLVTLDVPNNFPQLPIVTDGPYLVWLGVVKDEASLAKLNTVFASTGSALQQGDVLRSAPEVAVMDPTPRSRLRWLP